MKPLEQDGAKRDLAAHTAAQSAHPGTLTTEQIRARGRRNVAIALGLVAFVALIFVVTVIQLKDGIPERPL